MKVQRLLSSVLLVSLVVVLGQGAARAEAPSDVTLLHASPLEKAATFSGESSVDHAPPGWWASVQEDIRRSEYTVTWQGRAYQAPNRAHNLRTHFTQTDALSVDRVSAGTAPAGIRVLPRSGDVSAWEWGLALRGYGYEGAIQPAPDARQMVSGNRVEYHRENIVEWYVNDEQGLEQGFTLASPPPVMHGAEDNGSPAPLHIDMTLAGDLTPVLVENRTALEFITPDGVHVLRYGHLYAYDATGRPLPAHLDLVPAAHSTLHNTQYVLRIILDDSQATFPITIDPLLTAPSWTMEGEQGQAYLGASVSTAGDVNGDGYDDVILGAPRYDGGEWDTGRSFVYLGSASGLAASAAWKVYGQSSGERFGGAVGTAGDVNKDGYDDVIVGAITYEGSYWAEGRAYVYHGSRSGLSATPDWTVQGGQSSAQLGASVGTAGDVNDDGYDDVIVGAVGHHDGLPNVGRAYVYHGSASGLRAAAAWTIQGNAAKVRLGTSVGTAGDVNRDGYDDVIVGAPGLDDETPRMGTVYVYHGSATGLDARSPDWAGSSGRADDRFGFSVGTAGDVNGDGYADIIVGAPGHDENSPVLGQVYVYQGSSTGLSTDSPDWAAKSEQARDRFGIAVGAAGDINGDGYDDLVVGAPRYDGDQTDEGQIYVYYGSTSGPRERPDWTARGDQSDACFGVAVGSAGDVNGDGYSDLLAGAPYWDNGQADEGRVYLYYGPAPSLSTMPDWTAESGQQGARFGMSVNMAGDVNGDGYGDVLIGVPYYDAGQTNEGRAYVYHGGAAGLSSTPSWWAESDQAGAYLGARLNTAGDVNGDGYDDVIVGAGAYDNDRKDDGRAYVYYGSASGLGVTADWIAEGGQGGMKFGLPVGTAGDVNGDGYGDVLVGARYYDGGQKDEGRVYVYYGSASGLGSVADWKAESDQAGAEYGRAASAAGDLNGDGYSDLVVGAPYYDDRRTNEGRVYVYYGSATGLTTGGADWTQRGGQARAEYGRAAGTAGDVNGDGYADLIVGAPRYSGGQTDEGRVFVYYGGSAGLASIPAWTSEGDQVGAQYGQAVATAGDLNGDGYADVVIGAPTFDTVHEDEGRVFAYYGGPAGLSTGTPDWAAGSDQPGAQLGTSVGTAGDVNGDGYAELVVGAPFYDDGEINGGRVYVYYGPALGQGTPAWTAAGEPYVDFPLDWFGESVGTAGDVNGDGYADVIVGAPGYDGGLDNQGRIHLYLGSPSGLSKMAHWVAIGERADSWFGISTGTAGDVNGDGYADVIAGAAGYPFGDDQFRGRAYVYHGSPAGPGTMPAWRVEDDRTGTLFGRAVSTAGDVNGDGYADVVIGAPDRDTSQQDAGRAHVYLGSPSGLGLSPAWTTEGAQADANYGQSASTAGDVNGDGYADVIVGAPGVAYVGSMTYGRARVYLGSASGLNTVASWAIEDDQKSSLLGASVSTAGDVNGDGYGDVIVGAPRYDATAWQESEGRASVFLGSVAGLSTMAGWTAEGERPEQEFGSSVSTAGDVDGDGYSDVIVGAPSYFGEGRAYVYRGGSNGLEAIPFERTTDNRYESYYGNCVKTAGDVNGDGYADLVIGAPGNARAHVRYGSGSGAGPAPRQRRADNSAPVAHLGRVQGTAFRLAALGRTPFGRSKVKLEWEVKPFGVPLDGLGTRQSPAWIDTGTVGAQLGTLVGDLDANTAYHWRVRLRYHPATTPYQQYSRWLTVPRNGWQEQDLRTGSSTVQFSSASYRAYKGAGTATITVTLSAVSRLVATVDYATEDGTAVAGKDYVATSGTLIFAPGKRTQTFDVPLLDNAAIGGDKTVRLTLENASNVSIAAPNLATLTLVDDNQPPRVRFQKTAYHTHVKAGTAPITVTLSAPSARTVRVGYATAGGTAVPGKDYTPTSGTLTFHPGQMAHIFSVPILGGRSSGEDKIVNLVLRDPVNATIEGPNPVSLTIVDREWLMLYLPKVRHGN